MSEILIHCVVVLYKCPFETSKTLQSLMQICQSQRALAQQISLLVYDNSPSPQKIADIRWDCGAFEYRHDEGNGGLVAAYNAALAIAQAQKAGWLLLLDQDTVLDISLLQKLHETITSHMPENTCAIVPKLIRRGKILSPQQVGRFHNYDLPAKDSGLQDQQVTALNSAACLRVSDVIAVGGFPSVYWLDYLDHIMFHRLQLAGGRVFVLDIVMEHHLSLDNIEKEMSIERYTNLLLAEWHFVRETHWGGGAAFHRLRLLKRALRYALCLRNKAYSMQTLRAIGQ